MVTALALQHKPVAELAFDRDSEVRAEAVIVALNNARLAGHSQLLFLCHNDGKVAQAIASTQSIINGMAIEGESFEFTVTDLGTNEYPGSIRRLDIRLKR
jgi:hypothetical protein